MSAPIFGAVQKETAGAKPLTGINRRLVLQRSANVAKVLASERERSTSFAMLCQRDLYECAWHVILLHGAAGAAGVADERIAEMRDQGCVAGAEMWEAVKAAIPELLAQPEVWDELPSETPFAFVI
jgi:hypothetical protein